MPIADPKALHDYPDEISRPIMKAFEQPGIPVLAEEGISEKRAKYLHVRMQAAIRGMLVFYHPDHEYYRAALNKRVQLRRPKFPANPEFYNLYVTYAGMIKRPSEEFAEFYAEMIKKSQSTSE